MIDFFKKQVLGVDLGSRTIKGVRLKKEKNGAVRLAAHFFQDLSEVSEKFPEETDTSEALKASLETHRLNASLASTSIRDSEIRSFQFSLPPMSDKELRQVIPQEIGEQASYISMDEHSFDFIVSPSPDHNPDVTQVKAYCVKRDVVTEQMEKLKKAGLKPKAIESEMMAIAAMLEFNEYIKKDEVYVVLDLGESHLVSGLIVDGNMTLTRSQELSFGWINKHIQETCGLSYEDAEKAKKEYDFLSAQDNQNNPINHALDEAFTQIFKSIKEIIEFYRDCPESYGRIDQILLIGGASQVKRINQIHETFFKIPTTIVNPFKNIEIFSHDEKEISNEEIAHLAPYMGTAVGLALASISEEKKA